jgi:hypothetical protein
MGCNSSLCAEEADTDSHVISRKNKNDRENQETIEQNIKENNKNGEDKKIKEEKDNIYLNLKTQSKQKISDKEIMPINIEDNKDALSNILTEGVFTCDGNRMAMQKQQYNGITVMKGIEDYFSEDLSKDEILQLVEDALGDNILDYDGEYIPGTITSKQARAIANILYEKLNRKNNDEDEKSRDIDLKRYPELKGVNIKIGVSELTKDVIKDMMFNGQKVDDCQIELTYANLTKGNENLKALSIQILP